MPEQMASVSLVRLRPEDADIIAAWGEDAEFRRAAEWSDRSTFVERAARLRSLIQNPPRDLFRLGVQHQGVLVGYVDLRGADPRERELGYVIGDRSRWGRGLGFAAASAACVYAFEDLRLTTITADVAVANSRSIAILSGLGMRELDAQTTSERRRFVLHRHDA